MKAKQIYQKYAELILKLGVNLSYKQSLQIVCEPEHLPLVLTIEAEAYKIGAQYVLIDICPPQSSVNATNLLCKELIPTCERSFRKHVLEKKIEENWAIIYFCDNENAKLLSKIDTKKEAQKSKILSPTSKPFQDAKHIGLVPWTVILYPTKKWSAELLNLPATKATVNKAWDILIPILKLDQPDPIKAWLEHSDRLQKRAKALNNIHINHLRFFNKNTDFTVSLPSNVKWEAALKKRFDGKDILVNIPTEEVFTTPHRKRINGSIRTTKPVDIMGKRIKELTFSFKDGRVSEFKASNDEETVEQFLDLGPNNRYVGEIALVDSESVINKTGLIFNEILFDENAACHFALGSCYSSNFIDLPNTEDDTLLANGGNISDYHIDFMFGSEDMTIIADNNIEIMKKGKLRF